MEKLLKAINIHVPLAATVSGSKQASTQQQYELDACPILLAMIRTLATQVKYKQFHTFSHSSSLG